MKDTFEDKQVEVFWFPLPSFLSWRCKMIEIPRGKNHIFQLLAAACSPLCMTGAKQMRTEDICLEMFDNMGALPRCPFDEKLMIY